jgi:hypothetical protein
MVFVSKFYLDYPLAAYGGLVLLFAATLWAVCAKKRATPRGDDCGC